MECQNSINDLMTLKRPIT